MLLCTSVATNYQIIFIVWIRKIFHLICQHKSSFFCIVLFKSLPFLTGQLCHWLSQFPKLKSLHFQVFSQIGGGNFRTSWSIILILHSISDSHHCSDFHRFPPPDDLHNVVGTHVIQLPSYILPRGRVAPSYPPERKASQNLEIVFLGTFDKSTLSCHQRSQVNYIVKLFQIVSWKWKLFIFKTYQMNYSLI